MHHWRSALRDPGAETRLDPVVHVLSAAALFGLQIMAATAGVDGESLPGAIADPAVVALLQVRALCLVAMTPLCVETSRRGL